MKEIICPNCKKPLYDGEELFCHFCGESLRKTGHGFFGRLRYGRLQPVLIAIILIILLMFIFWAVFF